MDETTNGRLKLKVAIEPPIKGPKMRPKAAKLWAVPKTIPCSSGLDSMEIKDWVFIIKRLTEKGVNKPTTKVSKTKGESPIKKIDMLKTIRANLIK